MKHVCEPADLAALIMLQCLPASGLATAQSAGTQNSNNKEAWFADATPAVKITPPGSHAGEFCHEWLRHQHCVAAEGIATEFDGSGSGLNCP